MRDAISPEERTGTIAVEHITQDIISKVQKNNPPKQYDGPGKLLQSSQGLVSGINKSTIKNKPNFQVDNHIQPIVSGSDSKSSNRNKQSVGCQTGF